MIKGQTKKLEIIKLSFLILCNLQLKISYDFVTMCNVDKVLFCIDSQCVQICRLCGVYSADRTQRAIVQSSKLSYSWGQCQP